MNDADIISELKTLKDAIAFNEHKQLGGSDETPEEKLRIWKKSFGEVSPQKIYAILSKKYPEIKLHFLNYAAKTDAEQITFDLIGQKGKDYARLAFEISYPLNLSEEIEAGGIEVAGGRGPLIAKELFLCMISLIHAEFPQIQHIDVITQETGSFAWAKIGFRPEEIGWRDDDPCTTRQYLQSQLDKIADQLTAEEKTAIERLIQSDDPKSIWQLADMSKKIQDPDSEQNTPVMLGRFLLEDSGWNGFLDLHDPEAMQRLKGYFSKLGIIVPVSEKQSMTRG